MTVEQIINECDAEIFISNVNAEAAAVEGDEAEAGFWYGRRTAFSDMLKFILTDGEG